MVLSYRATGDGLDPGKDGIREAYDRNDAGLFHNGTGVGW